MLSVGFNQFFFHEVPLTTHDGGSFEDGDISNFTDRSRCKYSTWTKSNNSHFWFSLILGQISFSKQKGLLVLSVGQCAIRKFRQAY